MDVFEAIRKRRSVRAFTNQPVSDNEVMKLIEAARWAPSAGNIQPWELVVIRDADIKHGLSVAALDQTFIEEAPVVIVVCANQLRSSNRYGSRGVNLYSLQDTAAATQNMLLAACALGLGTCWIGSFQEEDARKVLKLPDHVRPVAIIAVGHPGEKPIAPSRKPSSAIIHHEVFERK